MDSDGRPRSKSAFSFRSSKSDKSDKAKPKIDLHESRAEKRKSKFNETTKKNPNKAMNEPQPWETQPSIAALEKTTLTSIRAIQHRDAFGNIILEADISNPTRPRFERPLDTIRSFEAAIDNSYKRRSNMPRPDTYNATDSPPSRRSSYYGGNENHYNPRTSYNGAHPRRPDSVAENYGSGPPTPTRSRAYGNRVASDPTLSKLNGHGIYPVPGYHQSHDTVTTGISNGSHITEAWGNSTDPSSENSSIDRVAALNRSDQTDGNVNVANFSHGGQQQFQGPIMEEYGGHNGGAYPQPGYQHQSANGGSGGYANGGYSAPQMSSPVSPPSRNIIKLGGSGGSDSESNGTFTPQKPSVGGESKGWFKRKFTKN